MNFKRRRMPVRFKPDTATCPCCTISRRGPFRDARALDVTEDLDAIDHLHWAVAQDIDGWASDDFGDGTYHTECADCHLCIDCHDCECREIFTVTPPLRAPLAEIARAA